VNLLDQSFLKQFKTFAARVLSDLSFVTLTLDPPLQELPFQIFRTVCIPGQYLFIESSLPRRPGDTARVQSELFTATPSKGRCLKFWYHMLGADIGNLTVYMNVTGSKKLMPLWRLSGNQGNQWLNGKLPIKNTQSYTVRSVPHLFLNSRGTCFRPVLNHHYRFGGGGGGGGGKAAPLPLVQILLKNRVIS
jgi:hypothetical protein